MIQYLYSRGIKLKYYIFADESNTDKARYMLIGGIWVDEITYNQVIAECKKFKQENGWNEATKFNWKNLSKRRFHSIANLLTFSSSIIFNLTV